MMAKLWPHLHQGVVKSTEEKWNERFLRRRFSMQALMIGAIRMGILMSKIVIIVLL